MTPPIATEIIRAGPEAASEIQRILRDLCHLADGDSASLICIDLAAQPPHHTQSELRTSVTKVGVAAVECLNLYRDRAVTLIVLTAGCRLGITPRPEGYLVSVAGPELISGPTNRAPLRN